MHFCSYVKPLHIGRKGEGMYEIYAKLRDERAMTDYQVCKETGIPTSAISGWKTGRFTPKVDKLVKIAKLFNVTMDELLGITRQ